MASRDQGAVTDAGARLLAVSPDLKKLEKLVVTRNGLTAEGVAQSFDRLEAVHQTGEYPIESQRSR